MSADGSQPPKLLDELLLEDDELPAKLQALVHPLLPPRHVFRGPSDRVCLLNDRPERTLADRYEECRAERQSGIPRTEMLAYLFPTRADFIRAVGKEAGDSRIWGGIHYPMDNIAGVQLGKSVAQLFITWAQSDGSQ